MMQPVFIEIGIEVRESLMKSIKSVKSGESVESEGVGEGR